MLLLLKIMLFVSIILCSIGFIVKIFEPLQKIKEKANIDLNNILSIFKGNKKYSKATLSVFITLIIILLITIGIKYLIMISIPIIAKAYMFNIIITIIANVLYIPIKCLSVYMNKTYPMVEKSYPAITLLNGIITGVYCLILIGI